MHTRRILNIIIIMCAFMALLLTACGKAETEVTMDKKVANDVAVEKNETVEAKIDTRQEIVTEIPSDWTSIKFKGSKFSLEASVPFLQVQYEDDNNAYYGYSEGNSIMNLSVGYMDEASFVEGQNKSVGYGDYSPTEVGRQSLLAYTLVYDQEMYSENIWIPLKDSGIYINIYCDNKGAIKEFDNVKSAMMVCYNSIKVDDSLILDDKELLMENQYADIFITNKDKSDKDAALVEDDDTEINVDQNKENDNDDEVRQQEQEQSTTDWSKMPEDPRDWPESKLVEYYRTFGHYPPNFDPRDA